MKTNRVVRKVREADILVLKVLHYLTVGAGLFLLVVLGGAAPVLPPNAVLGVVVLVMAFQLKEIVDTYTLERSRAEHAETDDVAYPSGEYGIDPDEAQPTIQGR